MLPGEKGRNLAALGGFLLVCLAVAAFGAQFTPGEWYARLDKPGWTPPSFVFAPVWTLLYTLMAIAAWRVWMGEGRERAAALGLFGAQLMVNGIWSWLFFGRHAIGWALLDLLALWILVGVTTVQFFRVDRVAGGLFVPYWLWVTYALSLNVALWQLNP